MSDLTEGGGIEAMFEAICLGSSVGIPIRLSMVPSEFILCSNTYRIAIISYIFADKTIAIVIRINHTPSVKRKTFYRHST